MFEDSALKWLCALSSLLKLVTTSINKSNSLEGCSCMSKHKKKKKNLFKVVANFHIPMWQVKLWVALCCILLLWFPGSSINASLEGEANGLRVGRTQGNKVDRNEDVLRSGCYECLDLTLGGPDKGDRKARRRKVCKAQSIDYKINPKGERLKGDSTGVFFCLFVCLLGKPQMAEIKALIDGLESLKRDRMRKQSFWSFFD